MAWWAERAGRAGPEEMAAKAAAVMKAAAGGEGVWPGKPGPPILPRKEAVSRTAQFLRKTVAILEKPVALFRGFLPRRAVDR